MPGQDSQGFGKVKPMTRAFKVAFAGLAVIALLGCATKDLSRSEARRLNTESEGENPAQATMSALRTLAVAVEAYSVDYMFYPKVASGEAGELSSYVTPTYIRRLPVRDGWGSPFYWIGDEREGKGYTFYSVGADRERDPEWGGGPTTDPNKDIVLSNGQFVQWPQGLYPD
jgi:hypothetical protein